MEGERSTLPTCPSLASESEGPMCSGLYRCVALSCDASGHVLCVCITRVPVYTCLVCVGDGDAP